MYLLAAILLLAASSCKKQTINTAKSGMSAAPPLFYEVLDKNGKNILDTLNSPDSLTLSCNDNGLDKQFSDPILNLNVNPLTTIAKATLLGFKNYNGVAAIDYTMLQLSVGVQSPNSTALANPVHTFDLSYHGKSLGTIYFEYLRWNINQYTSWQQASVFTFNNAPVQMDSTSGRPIYVIHLQQ
jgi:hypothetical protein